MSDTAVLISGWDKYYDTVYPGFKYYWYRNWPIELDWPVYYASEEVDVPDFENIKTGGGSWAQHMKKALDQIPEEIKYIMVILDDVYITKDIGPLLEDVRLITKRSHLSRFEISWHADRPDRHKQLFIYTSDERPIYEILPDGPSPISLQVALWDREFLEKFLIFDDWSPWDFELTGSQLFNLHEEMRVLNKNWFVEDEWYTHVITKGEKNKNWYRLQEQDNWAQQLQQ